MKITHHPLPPDFDTLAEAEILPSDATEILVGETASGGFVFSYSAEVAAHGWYGRPDGTTYDTQRDALEAASKESPHADWYGSAEYEGEK